MRRSSLSDSRLSKSAAVHGSLRSSRMSSGPSDWKLKPRSGSSSCTEERPRSKTTPLTGRPIRSAARSSCAKLVCSSIKVTPGGTGSWANRSSAEASRSRPSRTPPGCRRSISARAYPPPPVVPDLDQVVDADDPGDSRDPGVLPLVGGQDDSSLGVEFALPGGAEHHAGESPLLGRRRRAQPQALLLRPFLGRIDLQAALGALGDDSPTGKLFPKAGGNRHPTLGVDRVPVGTEEHQMSSPVVPLSPLFPTLCHRQAERYHCDRYLSTNSD